MKHKRLNRDGWGFTYYPYYQMRIDDELFHGLACLIKMTDGEENYWETPKAGRIQVTGAGMYHQIMHPVISLINLYEMISSTKCPKRPFQPCMLFKCIKTSQSGKIKILLFFIPYIFP